MLGQARVADGEQVVVVEEVVGAAVEPVAPGRGGEQHPDGGGATPRGRRRRRGSVTGLVGRRSRRRPGGEVVVMRASRGRSIDDGSTLGSDDRCRRIVAPSGIRPRAGTEPRGPVRPYSAAMPWARRAAAVCAALAALALVVAVGFLAAAPDRTSWLDPRGRRAGRPRRPPRCRCSSPAGARAPWSAYCWACCRSRSPWWSRRRSGCSGWRPPTTPDRWAWLVAVTRRERVVDPRDVRPAAAPLPGRPGALAAVALGAADDRGDAPRSPRSTERWWTSRSARRWPTWTARSARRPGGGEVLALGRVRGAARARRWPARSRWCCGSGAPSASSASRSSGWPWPGSGCRSTPCSACSRS